MPLSSGPEVFQVLSRHVRGICGAAPPRESENCQNLLSRFSLLLLGFYVGINQSVLPVFLKRIVTTPRRVIVEVTRFRPRISTSYSRPIFVNKTAFALSSRFSHSFSEIFFLPLPLPKQAVFL